MELKVKKVLHNYIDVGRKGRSWKESKMNGEKSALFTVYFIINKVYVTWSEMLVCSLCKRKYHPLYHSEWMHSPYNNQTVMQNK